MKYEANALVNQLNFFENGRIQFMKIFTKSTIRNRPCLLTTICEKKKLLCVFFVVSFVI